jgi:hypothetical protein
MSNNRLLTRDNLEKRSLDDKRFMFCNEAESIHHIFFGCVVVSQAWEVVSKIVGFSLEANYESMAKCWLCNKRFGVVNMITSAVCCGLWKFMNVLCFQEVAWKGMSQVWHLVLPVL